MLNTDFVSNPSARPGVSLRRARVTGAPIYASSADAPSSGSAPPPSSRG